MNIKNTIKENIETKKTNVYPPNPPSSPVPGSVEYNYNLLVKKCGENTTKEEKEKLNSMRVHIENKTETGNYYW